MAYTCSHIGTLFKKERLMKALILSLWAMLVLHWHGISLVHHKDGTNEWVRFLGSGSRLNLPDISFHASKTGALTNINASYNGKAWHLWDSATAKSRVRQYFNWQAWRAESFARMVWSELSPRKCGECGERTKHWKGGLCLECRLEHSRAHWEAHVYH
jgi:hypothetical protein